MLRTTGLVIVVSWLSFMPIDARAQSPVSAHDVASVVRKELGALSGAGTVFRDSSGATRVISALDPGSMQRRELEWPVWAQPLIGGSEARLFDHSVDKRSSSHPPHVLVATTGPSTGCLVGGAREPQVDCLTDLLDIAVRDSGSARIAAALIVFLLDPYGGRRQIIGLANAQSPSDIRDHVPRKLMSQLPPARVMELDGGFFVELAAVSWPVDQFSDAPHVYMYQIWFPGFEDHVRIGSIQLWP